MHVLLLAFPVKLLPFQSCTAFPVKLLPFQSSDLPVRSSYCLSSQATCLSGQATAFPVMLLRFQSCYCLSSQVAAFSVMLLPHGRSPDSSLRMHLPVEGRGRGGGGCGLGGRACLGLERNEGGFFQLQGENPPVLQQITCKVWDANLPVCLSEHLQHFLCLTMYSASFRVATYS